jgi:hypothetical protein
MSYVPLGSPVSAGKPMCILGEISSTARSLIMGWSMGGRGKYGVMDAGGGGEGVPGEYNGPHLP